MIERAKRPKKEPEVADERATMLDDRLLHMTREEAKAYLDAHLQERGLASEDEATEPARQGLPKRSERRPASRRAQG